MSTVGSGNPQVKAIPCLAAALFFLNPPAKVWAADRLCSRAGYAVFPSPTAANTAHRKGRDHQARFRKHEGKRLRDRRPSRVRLDDTNLREVPVDPIIA